MTVSLDSYIGLGSEAELAQEHELFVMYKFESDPKIEVYFYQSHFQTWTHHY